jgi:Outer membrane protein beta-barrel domain
MSIASRTILPLGILALSVFPALAQESGSVQAMRIGPTAGYLTFGTYFTGPGGLRFSNDNAAAFGGGLEFPVWRDLSVIGNVLHATSDWSFQEVPLIGSLTLGGASLWFFDAGLRLHFPLGSKRTVLPFVEAGAGAIRYAVNNPLLEGQATNLAFVGGLGVTTRIGERLGVEARVKDYFASFKSVDDAAALGVNGRRAHTVGFLVGVHIGL